MEIAMSWKKVIAFNICIVLGCIASIFVVPPSTSVRSFLWGCAGIIVLYNGIIVAVKFRKVRPSGSAETSDTSAHRPLPLTFWIIIGILLLLLFLMNHGYIPS